MEEKPVPQNAEDDLEHEHHAHPSQSSKSIDPSRYSDSLIGIEPEHEQQVLQLARTRTGRSMTAGRTSMAIQEGEGLHNPFLSSADPTLDPFSDKFSLKAWLQTTMSIASTQEGKSPRRNVGVAF